MSKTNPVKVLDDRMEDLIDYLKHKLKIIGMINGLSDSQISDMERDFIARLAFAAIIGDDEKEPNKKPEKSDGLPVDVIKYLSYVNDHCNKSVCEDCIFFDQEGCRIKSTPNEWRI